MNSFAVDVFTNLNIPPGPHPSELLPHIQKPLLIIWGETDPWTPITGAKIYQDLAKISESVEFISIPNTGHCPHDERPEQVNPIILNWLNQHSF